MKIFVPFAVYVFTLVLLGAVAFGVLMALAAEDQSTRIGSLAEFVFVFSGWVTVLVLPAYVSGFVLRWFSNNAAPRSLVSWRVAASAFALAFGLAVMLQAYDCFVEGVGNCSTWAAHLLVYIVVMYTPALLGAWVGKAAADWWRRAMGV